MDWGGSWGKIEAVPLYPHIFSITYCIPNTLDFNIIHTVLIFICNTLDFPEIHTLLFFCAKGAH